MLAGVGGRTIAEAKRNLSYPEMLQWATYMRKRGRLSEQRILERGFALLASTVAGLVGGKAKADDYVEYMRAELPQGDKTEEAQAEDVMKFFQSKNKRR